MDEAKTMGQSHFPDDERAARLFDDLADELGGPDAIRPQQEMLIADMVKGELLKDLLWKDIQKRGIGAESYTGRGRAYKENKSIAAHLKTSDQQRRIMMALGFISREKDQPANDQDEDGFSEL